VAQLRLSRAIVRALGVMLFVAAGTAAGFCLREAFRVARPRDLVFAITAPIAIAIAVLGLILAFAPSAM
jgi:hypothetical protein